jgi:cytochrome c551/c552
MTIGHAQSFTPKIPRTWSEETLKDWATPVAGLNVRPTHLSEKEYYALPVRDLATYPVYFPGREPDGYWEKLQKLDEPKPLIEPEKLRTQADWVEAGRRVFHEASASLTITLDPAVIAAARNSETYAGRKPAPDGMVRFLGWLPTKDGIALTLAGTCAACHSQIRAAGAPTIGDPAALAFASASALRQRMRNTQILDGGGPFLMGTGPIGMKVFQAYAAPWVSHAGSEDWKQLTDSQWREHRAAFARSGAVPRWNGSLYYPAKTPDLIGIKDRNYIDHTATHLHRGIGDLMRYAALIMSAENVDFGPHHVISDGTTRLQARFSDEALYALALYIYSLEPPPNPNPFDAKAQAGQAIFAREGCGKCHTPPLYTSNKLTLAEGFKPPANKPASLDLFPISVGTDPGLALKTRKGTGYYKIPSLKGVWYRGRYLHDGSVATLEEMFNPGRLKDTHVPGGFIRAGATTGAIKGHEFGLKLDAAEREQLIAFLRTL